MRFSFKKTLASVLSAALVLSTFVGALTANAADATVAGTLTMDDVAVEVDGATQFDVVANITLEEASEYVEVAFKLALPQGVTVDGASVDALGTAVVDAATGAILVSVMGPVTEIPVTITLTAAADVETFTLAVAKIAYADVTEADETIDITDTAVVTITVAECEHDYDVDVDDATCTTDGLKTFTCKKCGYSYTETITATGVHNYTYTNNGEEHTKTCTVGGESATEGHTFIDGLCVCGAEEVKECVHTYGKVYMNKETYEWAQTCTQCGDTIAAAEKVQSGNLISSALLLEAAVGNNIGINRAAKNGITTLGYVDYYVEVAYETYGTGYVVENKIKKYASSEFNSQNSGKTVDYFKFTEVALYEMAKDFTINLYLLDAEGDVVAVNKSTTSIQAQALAYANKYKSDTKLIKALTDMIVYGAGVQQYFASINPGTAIDGAKLPTEGFEAYLDKASSLDELPAAFDTTSIGSKLVSTTGVQIARPTLVVGASNAVKMSIKANKSAGYKAENLKVVATYVDSYGKTIVDEVGFEKLEVSDGSNTVYTYVFNNLALYDLEKTMTFTVYDNGVAQYKYEYNVGYFINQYINNAQLGGIMKLMALFGQSAKDKLVG